MNMTKLIILLFFSLTLVACSKDITPTMVSQCQAKCSSHSGVSVDGIHELQTKEDNGPTLTIMGCTCVDNTQFFL